MAVDGEFLRSERETFRNCCFKLSVFVYKDDDSTRTNLNLLLDELTAAENSQRSVSEEVIFKHVKLGSATVNLPQYRLNDMTVVTPSTVYYIDLRQLLALLAKL